MDSLLNGAKVGIQTVLREGHDPNAPVPGADLTEQMDLLPLSASPAATPVAEGGKRGAGRPAGSKNRSTEEWRNFILSRYTSPLIGMAEIANRSVLELARELGFSSAVGRVAKPEELLELLKLQLQCMKELAPYIHSKMPMAIEAGEHGLINLTIGAVGPMAQQAVQEDVFRVDFIENESEQNQSLSESNFENSVADNSVVQSQSGKNKGKKSARATDLKSVDTGDKDGGAA